MQEAILLQQRWVGRSNFSKTHVFFEKQKSPSGLFCFVRLLSLFLRLEQHDADEEDQCAERIEPLPHHRAEVERSQWVEDHGGEDEYPHQDRSIMLV